MITSEYLYQHPPTGGDLKVAGGDLLEGAGTSGAR